MWSSWILELDRGKYFPYEGNYSTYLEKKAKRLEQEEREESGRQKAIKRRARVDPAGRRRRARPSPRRVSPSSTSSSPRRKSTSRARREILIQVPERLGGKVIEVKGVTKAYGDKLLFEDLSLHAAAGRHRRRDRPQRRRQVDPVQDHHRPGEAGLGRDRHRPDRPPRLRRPEPRPSRWQARTSGRRSPTGSIT